MLTPSWEATTQDGDVISEGQIHYIELFKKYAGKLTEFRLVDKHTYVCECKRPVLAPRVLVRVRMDANKRLIYRKRPALPNLANDWKPDTVWLVGWQQTLRHFTDLRGNPANIQSVVVLNERTGEVHFLDRYTEDVGAGTHAPELYVVEVDGGMRAVLDGQTPMRPAAGAIESEEQKDRDIAKIEKDS